MTLPQKPTDVGSSRTERRSQPRDMYGHSCDILQPRIRQRDRQRKQQHHYQDGSISGMGGIGVDLETDGGLVEEVHASQNGGNGFLVVRGIVRRCTAVRNGNRGFVLSEGVLEANFAELNSADGFSVFGATVTGNTAYQNGGAGLNTNASLYGSNTLLSNSRGAATELRAREFATNASYGS